MANESAREILDQRLARGEIDIEEYERLSAALKGGSPAGASTGDTTAAAGQDTPGAPPAAAQSARELPPGSMTQSGQFTASYRPSENLANIVTILFAAAIIGAALSIVVYAMQMELLERMNVGYDWTMEEAEASDARVAAVDIIFGLIALACTVFFLIWIYRVRSNLPPLGIHDARWSPGWAVGWWFIPVMNFFRPYEVMKEMWLASGADATPDAWRSAAATPLLGWWWAFFIISSLAGYVSIRFAFDDSGDIDMLQAFSVLTILSDVLWALASALAIPLVRGISARQAERSRTLAAA